MIDLALFIDRRLLLGGLGTALLAPYFQAVAQARPALALEAVAGTIAMKPDRSPTPFWQITGGPDAGPLRVRKGETVDVTLTNRLPVAVALNWIGLDGNPAAEPLDGRAAIAPNASATKSITFRHAGTMFVNLQPHGDAEARPAMARAIIVSEAEDLPIDRDEVMLFQAWRATPDRGDIATDTNGEQIFTVNNNATADITTAPHQRLRLRLINACQTTVIAIKISDEDVRVMAIDGQPAEPFLARNGLLVLSPESRVDVFIDAKSTSQITLLDGQKARPIGRLITSDAKPVRAGPLPPAPALPSNNLPAQLDLKSAVRVDLPIGSADWLTPSSLTSTTPPAFIAKRGRIVVLALTNRSAGPMIFHLHGHHFRLLDRLDDGWKPFWLDTLAIAAGATQRIAFAAEYPGLYRMATTTTDWAAPRNIRTYRID